MSIERNINNLSEGIGNMPRRLSFREKLGDTLFVNLQILSRIIFIFFGLFGYYFHDFYGVFVWGITGWIVGIWVRHSMGIRGTDSNSGFFIRMNERAEGSNRGILEWLLEKIRGSEFSQSKCKAISKAYNKSMIDLHKCTSLNEQQKVIMELDRKIKEISYDS